ncbi:MAG: tetratricopeptide repeat protein [Prolixibacteraceae bacterium]|nr:tetratricopeptide repeat protein [Prolixibacteraceae bacterium]
MKNTASIKYQPGTASDSIRPFQWRPVILIIGFIAVMLVMSGCTHSSLKKEHAHLLKGEASAQGMVMLYPHNGSIFPPEFPAPGFEWDDSTGTASEWQVFIADNSGSVLVRSKSYQSMWRPDSSQWQQLKHQQLKQPFTFTAIAPKGRLSFHPSCTIQFSFSEDSVGADIFFRAVTLPFSYAVKNVNTIEWYMGNVDGRKPRKMLENLPVCGNCHSFATEQPLLAMDVDYGNDKGSYAIASTLDTCILQADSIITWSNFKRNDNEPTYGLLSQISPDGNYVLSTVKDLSIFVAIDDNLAYSQLFFPIKGIVGIYNRKNETFSSLRGANDEHYVQSNPTWSPDGKTVIFARAEAYVNEKVRQAGRALLSANDITEFTTGGKPFKYDLYTLDFNDGKGGIAKPLEGASGNGMSNYFPKFSPDGKWIVFCQAENFMLLQPDSRLYIMPAGGGEPRLMNCNMEEMNSWHSWSPNGRWLVFSSKNRGLYTQLYLTHIDENGIDSPPVLLENLSFEKRAANIPEFYPFDGDRFLKIKDAFSETAEHYNRGAIDKISSKYYLRARADLDQALRLDSTLIETYFNRIKLNNLLRQSNSFEDIAEKTKALQLVNASLASQPHNENYQVLRISLLSALGRDQDAQRELTSAFKNRPESYALHELQSAIYRKENQQNKAIESYRSMLKIDPTKKKQLYHSMATAYSKIQASDKALELINQAIGDYPDDDEFLLLRAQILMSMKAFEPAKKDLDYLMSKDASNYRYTSSLAQFHFLQGNQQQYQKLQENTIAYLNKASKENPEDVEVIFEMAELYLSQKNFQEANKCYDLILNHYPYNYEALKQKAIIYLSTQRWNDAIAMYNRLEQHYRPEEGFCNNKAIAYIQLGNVTKALEYFNKTLELNPHNQDALFNKNKLVRSRQ